MWHDPRTGMYVVTRYDDMRAILLDTEHFANGTQPRRPLPTPRRRSSGRSKIAALYEEKGWVPVADARRA